MLVQPSSYGTRDHSILAAALASDREHLRGVACVEPTVEDAELRRLAASGVVATRVQDGYPGGVPVTDLVAVAEHVRHLGWHLEIWSDLRQHLDWLPDAITDLDMDVVIDHLAYIPSNVELAHPVMREVLQLLHNSRVWITLSGAERLLPPNADPHDQRTLANHDAAITDRVRAFIDVAPDRVLWGSDWPHVGLSQHQQPTAADILARWERWVPDALTRQRIVGVNNAIRYGFLQPTTG